MSYGDEWKNHRKVFHQFFNQNVVERYRHIQRHAACRVLRRARGGFLIFLIWQALPRASRGGAWTEPSISVSQFLLSLLDLGLTHPCRAFLASQGLPPYVSPTRVKADFVPRKQPTKTAYQATKVTVRGGDFLWNLARDPTPLDLIFSTTGTTVAPTRGR